MLVRHCLKLKAFTARFLQNKTHLSHLYLKRVGLRTHHPFSYLIAKDVPFYSVDQALFRTAYSVRVFVLVVEATCAQPCHHIPIAEPGWTA